MIVNLIGAGRVVPFTALILAAFVSKSAHEPTPQPAEKNSLAASEQMNAADHSRIARSSWRAYPLKAGAY
jgi:hypothetical protein